MSPASLRSSADEYRGEDDRPALRLFQDSSITTLGPGRLPIERIHVPDDDPITEIFVDPVLLVRGDGTVRRPQQRRAFPDRGHDCVIGFLQFAAHGVVGHFAQVRMRPGMVRDLMAFADGALQDIGMVRRVLADDEKRRLHMMRCEEIEQLRRKSRVRAVIERQGDIRSVDMDGIESDRRLEWRGGSLGGRSGTASFNGLRRRRVCPENGLHNQETRPRRTRAVVGRTWDGEGESGKLSGVSSRGDMQRKPRRPFSFTGPNLPTRQRIWQQGISCDIFRILGSYPASKEALITHPLERGGASGAEWDSGAASSWASP